MLFITIDYFYYYVFSGIDKFTKDLCGLMLCQILTEYYSWYLLRCTVETLANAVRITDAVPGFFKIVYNDQIFIG